MIDDVAVVGLLWSLGGASKDFGETPDLTIPGVRSWIFKSNLLQIPQCQHCTV